jgi:hypothetical protein
MTDFGAKLMSFGRSRRRNPKKISSDARPSFPRPFFRPVAGKSTVRLASIDAPRLRALFRD